MNEITGERASKLALCAIKNVEFTTCEEQSDEQQERTSTLHLKGPSRTLSALRKTSGMLQRPDSTVETEERRESVFSTGLQSIVAVDRCEQCNRGVIFQS